MTGLAQNATEHLTRHRESSRNRDFGAVQHHVVRQRERWTHDAERNRRIENDQVGLHTTRHVVDSIDHPRVRQKNGFAHALDVKGLSRVELVGPLIRTRENGERVGRKSPPPLPQQ